MVTKVSQCRRRHMTVSNDRCSRQKVKGLFQWRRAEGSGNYSNHQPMCACHPMCSTRLYSRVKIADSRSGKGEPSDKVCEVVEALVSFISFGIILVSLCSRYEKREKVTDRRKQNADTALKSIYTYGTFLQTSLCLFSFNKTYHIKYRTVDVLQRYYHTMRFWYCYIPIRNHTHCSDDCYLIIIFM